MMLDHYLIVPVCDNPCEQSQTHTYTYNKDTVPPLSSRTCPVIWCLPVLPPPHSDSPDGTDAYVIKEI